MKKRITIALSITLALIYLISGIAKAADINGFGDLLVKYGFSKLYLLAPIITFIEIVIAFAFLLFWNTRKVALFSLVFITFISSIFVFGILFLGIDDCGCFGSFYEFPIWLSIFRNILMIFSSYWLYRNAFLFKNNRFEIVKPVITFSLGLVTLFITGSEMKETYLEVSYTQGDEIKNTFLYQYDHKGEKENLIFIFSPRCKHCKLITEKVNKLLEQNKYHDIIGLYPQEVRKKTVKEYVSKFNPKFKTVPIPNDSITKIAKNFPLFIILKNGKIIKTTNEI